MRQMARILYFSRDYTPHDWRFLEALDKTDHQIYYLRLERGAHPLESRPLPTGVKPVPWVGGRGRVSFSRFPFLLVHLKRVIAKIKPHLIHAGPIQSSAFLVALSGFRPLVSMSWGYDLLIDADRNAVWHWATRFALRRSDAFVGDCNTIRKRAVSLGMLEDRIITFPWGVDLSHFTPGDRWRQTSSGKSEYHDTRNNLSSDVHPGMDDALSRFTLLSTRSWEPIYGVDVIARAFIDVSKIIPDVRLVMLGNGSQGEFLRAVFSDAGVLDRVSFPGQVSHTDLPEYYRMADLYVSASHSDGASISLLEAMACGCPVLVSDIPGNLEWVEQDINGWSFPDGDTGSLAQIIIKAYENRNRLRELGRAARLIAEARADWTKNFPNLLRAYGMASDQVFAIRDLVI